MVVKPTIKVPEDFVSSEGLLNFHDSTLWLLPWERANALCPFMVEGKRGRLIFLSPFINLISFMSAEPSSSKASTCQYDNKAVLGSNV